MANVAPSIFDLDGKGLGAVVKNADFLSRYVPTNRAKTGDVIVIYLTGLGQTTPAVQTAHWYARHPVLQQHRGGYRHHRRNQSAPIVYSIASPSFAGLYQIAVTVPGSAAAMRRSSSTQAAEIEFRHSFGTVTMFKSRIGRAILAMAPSVVLLYAYATGPEPRHTAAPGDDKLACTTSGCHNHFR